MSEPVALGCLALPWWHRPGPCYMVKYHRALCFGYKMQRPTATFLHWSFCCREIFCCMQGDITKSGTSKPSGLMPLG
ncbi:hypothetical protein D0Y65_032792 [Glycine soja]|uniref:Uncharacterized protein n=1 Tax=Glycine soja TaxID=3848 RepID=A0A445IF21_GLYSO|nr:hypothetical protein JHK87_038202 [Glycine soja]KAG4978963.1 hypothetical protein JHK86_038437 [Glycine max]RZB84651.1 hypothetical protein D0Y65_032792 [Glycine soja]